VYQTFRPRLNYMRIYGANRPAAWIPALLTPSSLTGGQVARAYGMTKLAVALPPVKIGIVALGGELRQADVNAIYAEDGLPPPKLETVSVDGGGPAPDPSGADVEAALDVICGIPWAIATGQAPQVAISYAPNTGPAIGHSYRALVDAGCGIVTCSWGAPRTQWTPQDVASTEADCAYCQAKKAWLFAASGDNSVNDGTATPAVDYTCSSPYVIAVGGTLLALGAGGVIISESAWGDGRPGDEGGGGGFDPNTPRPPWQTGVPGTYRGCPDCAANADPASGYKIICNGQQMAVGGTSGASPLVAGIFAVIKAAMLAKGVLIPNALGPLLYANPGAFHDITVGSNGKPAVTGWDAATGLGTPNVPALLAAFTGAGTTPPPPPPPSGGPTLQQVEAADTNVFAHLQRSFRNVRGAAPVLSAGLADLESKHAALFAGAHDIEGAAVEPYPTERVSL
jgi:kumamolisin